MELNWKCSLKANKDILHFRLNMGLIARLYIPGYPRHRENREKRENCQKNPGQGKHREFRNVVITQGKDRELCQTF